MIVCKGCGKEFERRKPTGQVPKHCSSACRAAARKRRQSPEKIAARDAQAREWLLQNKYGISADEYDELLRKQGGVCAICSSEPLGGSTSTRCLHVDHCHETGRIRGLLCSTCNTGLGLFKDSEELLWKAASYLTS